MSDLISRQDAIRIVDGIDTWQAGWRGDAIESIKALPSAQPEIIRCKECIYFECDIQRSWGKYNGCGVWTDDGDEIEVKPDDFCSRAKRRTDGDDNFQPVK